MTATQAERAKELSREVAIAKGWTCETLTDSWVMPDGHSRIFGVPDYTAPSMWAGLLEELIRQRLVVALFDDERGVFTVQLIGASYEARSLALAVCAAWVAAQPGGQP